MKIHKRFLSTLSIAAMTFIMALLVSVPAHAAEGDIINTSNKKVYSITSQEAIKALILDMKSGTNGGWLKEGKDGKYYDPSEKLNLQTTEVVRILNVAKVDLKNPSAIKSYITKNAAAIVPSVTAQTENVTQKIIDISSYKTVNAVVDFGVKSIE
ncbi:MULTISPECIES: hypothetical protein [Clostridium]|uniref:S-layer homology domain-containing protein n=1 Tax=Clostridium frigoriphilum TaxID=443253 RepID=A0ABU7UTL4_9CLOT|nr:hypothetical protein [Clostridium sp. DSM 17811]MBU3101573.1 hypothetical protein [Clostridium sp. DSM 17811]